MWTWEKKAKASLAIIFLLWLSACLLTSCVTTEKAINHLKENGRLSEVCATEYPVIDSVLYLPGDTVFDIITIPGDTLIHFDTIWRNQYGYRIDTIRLKCPPNITITKTVYDTIRVIRENTARVEMLTQKVEGYEFKLQKETERADYWKSKAKHRMGPVNWLVAILIALLIYTFRKPIFKTVFKLVRPF